MLYSIGEIMLISGMTIISGAIIFEAIKRGGLYGLLSVLVVILIISGIFLMYYGG